jgi:hypothetical protein
MTNSSKTDHSAIGRRTFLRNAGAGFGFPMLTAGAGAGLLTASSNVSAATPSKSPPTASRKNLVIIVNMLGYNRHTFHPKGDDLDKSPLLARLKGHYNDLTVFKNIMQPEIDRGHNGGRGILTCNKNQQNGPFISLDQLASEHLQQTTRYKSVHIGNKTIVWNKDSRAVPTLHEAGPEAIYTHLFGQTPTEQLAKKLQSVRAMRQSLPQKSRAAYIASMDEHERALATDLEWARKPIPEVPFDTKLHLTDHHDRGVMDPFAQHLEMIKLAILHNRGQVFVASPPFVDKTDYGVQLGYHALGHRAHESTAIYEDMLGLEQHFMDCLVGFMTSLKTDKLLDDTIVLFMGAFSSPGGHSREYLPTILAGGGFNHQGLIECKEGDTTRYPLSHLYVSILHQMGIDLNEFSGHEGNLDRLLG